MRQQLRKIFFSLHHFSALVKFSDPLDIRNKQPPESDRPEAVHLTADQH